MRYILDHYYANDHFDFCRVVESDLDDERKFGEMLVAIQFSFEDHVGETLDPDLDGVIALLEKHFGCRGIDKALCQNDVDAILDLVADVDYSSYERFEIGGTVYCYIDLYEAREQLCGPNSDKIVKKWIPESVVEDIKKLPSAG